MALADESRYNVLGAKLYLEFDYNKTLLDTGTLSLSSLSQYQPGKVGMIGVFSDMVTKATNKTGGDFIDTEGARDNVIASHLNASSSDINQYSSDLYASIDKPVSSSSIRGNGQKLANIDETSMSSSLRLTLCSTVDGSLLTLQI